jgi:hypothetical protein
LNQLEAFPKPAGGPKAGITRQFATIPRPQIAVSFCPVIAFFTAFFTQMSSHSAHRGLEKSSTPSALSVGSGAKPLQALENRGKRRRLPNADSARLGENGPVKVDGPWVREMNAVPWKRDYEIDSGFLGNKVRPA